MDTEKVSVIVPFYNSASVLEKCLVSVLSQTYTNFELVLVDDGSTDGSFALCQSYQVKDDRVKLYQKKNGGVSSARNYGLERASGAWITFLDADDYIENNFLLDLVADNKSNMVVGGFKRYGDKKDVIVPVTQLVDVKNDLNELWNKSVDKFIYWYPWGKLFRLDVIKANNLKFDERMFYSEDFCFLLSYLSCIECFFVKNVAGYCHLHENNRAKKYKMDFPTFLKHMNLQDLALERLEKLHGHFYKLVRQNVHRRLVDKFLGYLLNMDSYSVFKENREKFRAEVEYKSLSNEIASSWKRKLTNYFVFECSPIVGFSVKNILRFLFV